MIEEWKLGYLAGIIDGEGYIGIIEHGRLPALRFGLTVSVSNTNLELLSTLQEIFGGIIYNVTGKQDRKPIYSLMWTGNKAKDIINLILPKLIVKRKRAELLAIFPLTDGPGRRPSEEDKALRLGIYMKFKELDSIKEIEND